MSVWNDGSQLRAASLGGLVTKGPVTNPQTASSALFTVTGGLVLITSLVGEVTTVQGATANSFNLQFTKSGGSAADISAATVCTSDAVGTLYTITGVAADLLSVQQVGGSEVPNVTFGVSGIGAGKGIIVPAGSLTLKASGNNTGATTWRLTYIPIDDGAAVVAA
ncbi:MAG: hypothetical protein PVJ28_00205 [Acidimicrobiia bacterium]|jgi:hypothetical protein